MKRALALLLCAASASASAAEVTVSLADGKLDARIVALAYPATLQKELTSGLTNRLYVQASLLDASTVRAQQVIEIAVRYDLWDQKFTVTRTMNHAVEERPIGTPAEMHALLEALPLPRLFDAAAFAPSETLTLRVELLLNPIQREKARMIRKWVSENSAPELGGEPGISMSNALFNRIFEQFADGSDIAATWRVTVASAPFRIESLGNERH